MELRRISWISLAYFLFLSHSTESFFFPQFMRRERLVSSRGQVGGVEDVPVPSYRIINRPGPAPYNALRPLSEDSQGQQNFQVPDSLCQACGSFPWTPVAGQEQRPQQPAASSPPPSPPQQPQPQPSIEQQQQGNQPAFNIEEYPVHQHLEVTREPGNTVVINALGPDTEEGKRKPFAFQFASAPQNQVGPVKNEAQNPNPQQFGRPIVIPYEQSKQAQQSADIPRTPSASSVNSQTIIQPPHAFKPADSNQNRKPPGLYGSHSQPAFQAQPTLLQPLRYPGQQNHPHPGHLGDPRNIAPITVGTILAAQQQHYSIQPAQLIYQEHSQSQFFNHGQPSPRQPFASHSQPVMSYKIPIIPPRGPSGTVLINQVPLHAVPNYSPIPPAQYTPNFIPPQQQPQKHHFQFIETSNRLNYGPPPRQPKPGYPSGQIEFSSSNDKYRVPHQQQLHHQQQQPQQPQYSTINGQSGNGGYGRIPHKPLPPNSPYTPPQPSPYPRPFVSPPKEANPPTSPPSTYIPPRVTGQLFASYAEESKENEEIVTLNNINQEPKKTEANQVQFPSSDVQEAGSNSPVPSSSFFTLSTVLKSEDSSNQEHQQITIPHLLQLHQGYRFVDQASQPGKILSEGHVVSQQKELVSSDSQRKEQEQVKTEASTSSPFSNTVKVEVQTNEYVVRNPVGSGEDKGGRYEVHPATQYDITHLFATPPPGQGGESEKNEKQFDRNEKKTLFPLPVPVPVSESEVANSRAPLFVVSPPSPAENSPYFSSFFQQQPNGQENSQPNQEKASYFQPQPQYDPLPPSVVSALHHAQRTSFLTHSHHTANSPKTIYVNSIPVNENKEGPRLLRPIAFDLNSGKEIRIHQQGEGDFNTLSEGEERKRVIPVYRLQEESVHRPVLAATSESPGDQTVVNCQNNQHWVIPDGKKQTLQQQQVSDQSWSQGGFYYSPSPVYWVQETTLPTTTPLPTTTRYDEKAEDDEAEGTTQASLESKTYFAKPVVQWSKLIVPKTSPTTTTFSTTNQNEGEAGTTQPTHNLYGKDHVAQEEALADDKAESESKDYVSGAYTYSENYPVLVEQGGENRITEIVGPTTVADCVTEASTTPESTTFNGGDVEATTAATELKPSSPSFSPRIPSKSSDEKFRVRNGGSRFPTGRPTIPTYHRSTEDPYTGVSASVLVPVYRPPQSSYLAAKGPTTPNPPTTVEEIYLSHEMKELGKYDESSENATTAIPKITFSQPISSSSTEDDEADELRNQNQLGEIPTARRFPSSLPSHQSIGANTEDKTTTSRIRFSSQIIQSTPPTAQAPGATSTKIVKTVRVRQRMRPINLRGLLRNTEGTRSRVRVMSTAAAEHPRNHGEILGADEERAVNEALIEIKKI